VPRPLARGGGAGLVLALLLLGLTSVASASPTITTLAGGGTQTPLYYDNSGPSVQGPAALLPAPKGIAWSGDPTGIIYVIPTGIAPSATDPQCVLEWFQPDSGKDTGFVGMWGGTYEDCSALGGGYPATQCAGNPCGAKYVKLDHPCCVAADPRFNTADHLDYSFGPLVPSSNSGYVNFYPWWENTGETVLGGTRDPNCGADPVPAPPDGVDPTTAHFCTLTAIARRRAPRYDWLIAESGREAGVSDLYQVWEPDANNPITRTVSHRAHTNPITAVAWDDDAAFLPIIADSTSEVITLGAIQTNLAGNAGQPGFSGDGGQGQNSLVNHPQALTLGFDGQVYIADTNNCRIRRLTDALPTATISTLAGTGCSSANAPYGDGGPASSANLDHPAGLTMAPTGLVVADTGHDRLRLIDRTTITSAPTMTQSPSPTFTVESLDSPPHLKCKLDNGTAAVCTSPVQLSNVVDGSHELQVWENGAATDNSGPDPPDPTPAVADFKVDTTPPSGLSLLDPAPGATGVAVNGTFTWNEPRDATTGVDHYELWIDGSKSAYVPIIACVGGVCSGTPGAPLAESTHTWQVRAVDGVGNTASSEVRELTAGTAPTAVIQIIPNPSLIGRAVTVDGSRSTDDTGVTHYEWDLDGDGSYETDSGDSPTASRTYTAPASVNIGLRVSDASGKAATATQLLQVNQSSGQSLIGISVNSGAQYTRDPHVKLLVKAPANANAIVISNDGGFLAPQTFPIAASIPWTLDSSGPERLPKTVYARFLLGPIISTPYTDDIILDEIPPVVQQAAVTPAASAAHVASAATAKAKTWTLNVKAKDSNSGVGKVQVTADKRKPGKLLKYKRRLTVKSAKRPRFVRARDNAGNFSRWKRAK
jgi:hypothetical protein